MNKTTSTYLPADRYAAMSAVELRKAAQGKIPNAKQHRKAELIDLLVEWDAKAEAAFAADEAARVAREEADDKKATESDAKATKTKTQTRVQAKPAPAATDHESDAKTDKDGKPFKSTKAPKVGPVRHSAGTKAQQAAKAKKTSRKMCQICSKRPVDRKTQGRDSTMCEPCFEYAGWENTHSDNGHEGQGDWENAPQELVEEMADCPVCQSQDPANDVVKTKANGSKPGRTVSKPMATESKAFDAKAKAFATIAKAAGWSAKVNQISKTSAQVIATVRDGQSISMVWDGGAYQYDLSEHKDAKGHKAKIRNASAARKMLDA